MNSINLVGRLTANPELKTTTTGKSVASFTIAVDKRFKSGGEGAPTADFFRCQAWGQTAEFVSNYLAKGRLVSLTGRIESRKYTDKEGNNREAWEVTAETVNGLDRPKDSAVSDHPSTSQAATHMEDDYDPFA